MDGTPLELNWNDDIEVGKWNSRRRRFTPKGDNSSQINAIRITARRTAARGDAITLFFGGFIGQPTCDVTAVSVATFTAPVNYSTTVEATANPFLSGMPQGSVASLNNPHNSPDYAGNKWDPKQSPQVASIPLTPGQPISFEAISGTAGYDPNGSSYKPDGDTSYVGHNTNGSENGISDMNCPINALVGVFLDDNQPNYTTAPQSLDFSTAGSRNFQVLSPQLKQLFFIGDGKTDGGTTQEFVPPPGATRLYLATWDFYEWNNNYGERTVNVVQPVKVETVQ